MWVQLPPGVAEAPLTAECAARGVRVSPGTNYELTESGAGHLRLAFGKDDPATLHAAAIRIGDALETIADRAGRPAAVSRRRVRSGD